jgi:cardiolipin synthase
VAARKRGVPIEIIVPGTKIDAEITRKASRARWGDLLQAGIEIYEFQPTMFHCKVMIVDDLWVSVGSTNFDNRSFRLNDEANLNVLDGDFAMEQVRVFEADKKNAQHITYEMWKKRPFREKLAEHAAALFRSQL